MSEVELHVVCKHCGAEVSPYITECPYCGNRLRKRAPKLESRGAELAPKQDTGFFARFKRKPKTKTKPKPQPRSSEPALGWLSERRPYGTIALLVATGAVYVVNQMTTLGFYSTGALVGRVDSDFWRLITSQFSYSNIGYLFAVGIAIAIFGTSLERRYGALVPVGIFLLSGAAGMFLASQTETANTLLGVHLPIAIGGNGSALGLIAAWSVRERRDERETSESERDWLGVAVIAIVIALMPLIDTFASWWVALGGGAVGALLGLLLPARR